MSCSENLEKVLNAIRAAEEKAGRPTGSVRLVAVSKTVDEPVIREMFAAGQVVFGENRPQMLRDKAKSMADLGIHWHFIGPLQSNKIKYVFPVAEMVHSIDREELLLDFAAFAVKTGRKCPCLLEVHISEEESKQGFAAEQVLDVIRKFRNHEHLDIQGMMGMAPFTDDESLIRRSFRRLGELFSASKELEGSAYHARELSMGMSNDFVIAIEEGATLVRVGSALFAG